MIFLIINAVKEPFLKRNVMCANKIASTSTCSMAEELKRVLKMPEFKDWNLTVWC